MLVLLQTGTAPAVRARACAERARIDWSPARPRAGALFDVIVRGSTDGMTMHVAGVRLHPEAAHSASGVARITAAAPIDSVFGVTLRVECSAGGPQDWRIATDSGAYRLERLRVAPRFSAPPDSAVAERQRVEAERAARVSEASHDTPVLWRAPFAAPRASRITSRFGTGRTFNGEVVSRHLGTDYAGAVGAPIRAANRGVVRLTGAFYLGGNVVYVDHGAGLMTAYLHLSRTLVAEGDTVERGTVIARVGATGRVTGPHLHFIVRYGGITVDPLTLIGRR